MLMMQRSRKNDRDQIITSFLCRNLSLSRLRRPSFIGEEILLDKTGWSVIATKLIKKIGILLSLTFLLTSCGPKIVLKRKSAATIKLADELLLKDLGLMSSNLLQNTTNYTPSWESGRPFGTRLFRLKACTGNDCSSNCTTAVEPAESGVTPITNLLDGVSYYICVQHETTNNKITEWVSSNFSVAIDTTPPTISSNPITMPANARYVFNDNLDFSMTTSEIVTVTTTGGIPSLNLDISGDSRLAAYLQADASGGEIGTELTFRFTVDSSIEDYDGIGVASLISLNNGTIQDLAGNSLDLNFNPDATSGIFVDSKEPIDPSTITPIFSIIHDTSTYTPTWVNSVDGSFDYHELKACQNSDCSTDCLTTVTPAYNGSSDVTGMLDGLSYYMCVRGFDTVPLATPWVESIGRLTIDTSAGSSYLLTEGIDNLTGNASDNNFYDMGKTYYNNGTSDILDGGLGNDVLHLAGDYSAGATIDSNVTNIETLELIDSSFDYNILITGTTGLTTIDATSVNGDFVTIDAFSYKSQLTIYGGQSGNNIKGSKTHDVIYGGASDDTIYGEYGGDTIYGGAGNDHLYSDAFNVDLTSLGNLILYMDAADPYGYGRNLASTPFFDHGTRVNYWADKSSNANIAIGVTSERSATLTKNSTQYGGRPVLNFVNANNEYYRLKNEFLDQTDPAFFAVANILNIGGLFGTYSTGSRLYMFYQSATYFTFFRDAEGDTINNFFGANRVNPPFVFSNRLDSANGTSYSYLNGSTDTDTNGAYTPVTFENTTNGKPAIGAHANGTNSMDGNIAEILIYGEDIGDVTTERIDEYFAYKYQIDQTYDGLSFGQDIVSGGGGDDVFYFGAGTYSTESTPDRITDFGIGSDKIDLTGFDEMIYVVGTYGFSAGGRTELGWRDSGGNTLVDIDLGGDGTPDFTFQLDSYTYTNLSQDHFIFKNVVADGSDSTLNLTQNEAVKVAGGYGADTITTGAYNDVVYPDGMPFYGQTVSNMQIWLDGSDPYANMIRPSYGSVLTSWQNKGVKGYHATDVSGDPNMSSGPLSFNGRAGVYFDTGAEYFTFGSNYIFATGDGISIFSFVQSDTTSHDRFIVDFGSQATHSYSHSLTSTGFSNIIAGMASGGAATFTSTIKDFSINPILFSGIGEFNGTLSAFDNGVLEGTSDISGLSQLGAAEINESPTRVVTSSPVCIGIEGKTGNEATRNFNGNMGDVMMFDKYVKTYERKMVEYYLSLKYGYEHSDGALGQDYITVGDGDDRIVLTNAWYSAVGASADVVTDFRRSGDDKIVLMNMPEYYNFLGTAAFNASGDAEMRSEASGANSYLQFDINGDGTADRSIFLSGYNTLQASDIMQVGGDIYFDMSLSTAKTNSYADLTVTAKDLWGNTVKGYTGTVSFEISDASGAVPINYTFYPEDAGTHTFEEAVYVPNSGSTTIFITDGNGHSDKIVENFTASPVFDITTDTFNVVYPLSGFYDPIKRGTNVTFNYGVTSTNPLTSMTCKVYHANKTVNSMPCGSFPSLRMNNSVVVRGVIETTSDLGGKNYAVSWTPTYDQRGTYEFRLRASDGSTDVIKSIYLTVVDDITTDNIVQGFDGYVSDESVSDGMAGVPFRYRSGGGDLDDWLDLTSNYNGNLNSNFVTTTPWVGMGSTSPVAVKILELGPRGYWRLGEASNDTTILDYSGNGHHGTAYNGVITGQQGALIGDYNTSAFFDAGSSTYIDLGNPSGLKFGSGDFTINAWAKFPTNLGDSHVIYQCGSNDASGKRVRLRGTTTEQVTIEIDNDTAGAGAMFSTPINDDEWHMLTGVRDGNTLRIYVDGSEDTSVAADITGYGSIDDQFGCKIGSGTSATTGTPAEHYDGSADEIAVYNYAVSAANIAELYQLGKGEQQNIPHALTFDGVNDYADLMTPLDSEASTRMLFSTWIKLDDASSTGNVILGNGGGAGNGFQLEQSAFVPGHLELKVGTAHTSAYETMVNAYNPVGYWRLGEAAGTTADDYALMTSCSSGTALCSGTYVNGPTLGQTGAIQNDIDTSVFFDESSDQYVDVSDDPAMRQGGTDFTIMAWVNSTADFSMATGLQRRIIASMGSTGRRYQLAMGELTAGSIAVEIDDNTTRQYVETSGDYNDGDWHLTVGIKEGDWLKLYVDGTQDGTFVNVAGYGTLDDVGNGFKIGHLEGISRHFHGHIDEVAVFNYAMTYGQQKAIYEAGANNRCISGTNFMNDKWYHVSGMYDGTNAYLYVNGKLECVVAASNLSAPSTGLFAGATAAGANKWDGTLASLLMMGTTGASVGNATTVYDIYRKTVNQTRITQIEDIYEGSNLVFHFDAANMVNGNETTTDTCPTLEIVDLSKHRNIGRADGFSSCDASSGVVGSGRSGNPYSINFDGSDDGIVFPFLPDYSFDTGEDITVEAWIRYDVISEWIRIVSLDYDPSTANWALTQGGVAGALAFSFQRYAGGGWNVSTTTPTTYGDGNWHHVVVTYTYSSGGSLLWYIDGESVAHTWTASVGNDNPYVGKKDQPVLTIGSKADKGGIRDLFFDGNIVVIRVYREILTQEQVKQNCHAQKKRFSTAEDICAAP